MNEIIFKTRLIKEKNRIELSLPRPSDLGCKEYYYIALLDIPKHLRKKGMATKLISSFCDKVKKPVYAALNKSKKMDMNGFVLLPLFERLGFKVIDKYEDQVIKIYRDRRS